VGAVEWVLTMLVVFLTMIIALLLDGERGGQGARPNLPSSSSTSPNRDQDQVVDYVEAEPVVRR